MSDSREAFEKLLVSEGYAKEYFVYLKETDTYQSTVINNMWWAWQAATEQQQSVIAELVEALEAAVDHIGCIDYISDEEKESDDVIIKYRALLAKVKGVKSE